eukprot:CAMPEP_0185777842 /NCGR_PEP_ID=MMETSP1174-20130828/90951_1 /TAXON_ID=35687 /ORGANISM="Dictyocha speculum, Strain CCMP1381" /LENGTH=65 /DNA_ID=CAMNT_0028466381 /DNA_START=32 /DNA_END=226 /DNA_ORIENTATION=-
MTSVVTGTTDDDDEVGNSNEDTTGLGGYDDVTNLRDDEPALDVWNDEEEDDAAGFRLPGMGGRLP